MSKRQNKEVVVVAKVHIEDLANAIDSNQAFEWIKAIDLAQADWGFTRSVAEYFVVEMAKFEAGEDEEDRIDMGKWLEGLLKKASKEHRKLNAKRGE